MRAFELWTRNDAEGQFTTTPGGGDQQSLDVELTPAATWHHWAGWVGEQLYAHVIGAAPRDHPRLP